MRNPPFLKGESKGDLKVGIALMQPAGSLIKITTTLVYGERRRTMVIRIPRMFMGE
jgi:hypothetical protein